jgi:uncharacterized delta-60 repeat protein
MPSAVAQLSNGDLLVAGTFGVVRFLSNGQLDPGFGSGGYAQLGFQTASVGPPGLAVQADGKVIWVGSSAVSNPAPGSDGTNVAVERFNANGTPDTTFGHGGTVTTDFPTGGLATETAQAAVVEPNGKIVVGGVLSFSGYRGGKAETALARYNPDGSLDTTFGSAGEVVSNPGGVRAVGLDAGGDIFVLPGETEFSPTGQKDASVSASAITASSLGGGGPYLFLSNGQTLAGGSVTPIHRDNDAEVQRLNADRTVDTTFASPAIDYNGIELTGSFGVFSLALQGDGKTLLEGAVGLARVNGNETLDPSFGNGGFEQATFATCIVVLPNGKFMTVGWTSNNTTGGTDLTLTRYFQ